MLNEQLIHEAVRRIVAVAHRPSKIILFGSYARGDAEVGSDVDLMVVEREIPNTGEEMMLLADAVGGLPLDVDILVYSEIEFEQRKDWCSTPVYWAAREGKVLYELGQ